MNSTLRLRSITIRPDQVELWSVKKLRRFWAFHWGTNLLIDQHLVGDAVRYSLAPAVPTHEIEQRRYL